LYVWGYVHNVVRLCERGAEQILSDVESAGACSIYIRTLLERKYALPYRVNDALVFHFLRFRVVQEDAAPGGVRGANYSRKGATVQGLSVLWHQSLLAFAQRYKNEINEDQREALLDLLLARGYKQIGPEVKRELLEGRGRETMIEPEVGGAVGGDDTMMGM
jgi:essential nuclear protein 1